MRAAVAGAAAAGRAIEAFLGGDGEFAASLAPAGEEGWGEEVGDGFGWDSLSGGAAAWGHVLRIAHGKFEGAPNAGVAHAVLAGEEGGFSGWVVGEADDAGDGFGFRFDFRFGFGFGLWFWLSGCKFGFWFGRLWWL